MNIHISLAHPARWIGARAEGALINGLVCLALCTRVNNYGYDVTYKYCIPVFAVLTLVINMHGYQIYLENKRSKAALFPKPVGRITTMSSPSQKLLIRTLYSSFKWLYPKKLVSLSNCIAITQRNHHCLDDYDQISFELCSNHE